MQSGREDLFQFEHESAQGAAALGSCPFAGANLRAVLSEDESQQERLIRVHSLPFVPRFFPQCRSLPVVGKRMKSDRPLAPGEDALLIRMGRGQQVLIIGDDGLNSRHCICHWIWMTPELRERFEKARVFKGAPLGKDEITAIALSDDSRALTDLSPYSLRAQVEAYYGSRNGFSMEPDIANYFVSNAPVNWAFLSFALRASATGSTRIKELSAGKNPTRWKVFSEYLRGNNLSVDAVITDFKRPPESFMRAIPWHDKLRVRSEALNLLEPLPPLPDQARFDLMLSTYTFDCVWFPGDFQYTKVGDEWSKVHYRLKAPGLLADPRWIQKFRTTGDPGLAGLKDLGSILCDFALEAVDIDREPYGEFLKKRAGKREFAMLNVPAGLVDTVVEAFSKQLRQDGWFITGDVGVDGRSSLSFESTLLVGEAALYRYVDFALAKQILESRGYVVCLWPVNKFIRQVNYPGWEKHADRMDLAELQHNDGGTFIMAVTRDRRAFLRMMKSIRDAGAE